MSSSALRRRLVVASVGLALTASGFVASAAPSGAAASALPAGPQLALTADTSWWGTNGRVTDIVTDGTSAWLSGAFDYLGPTTGRGVLVDAATGARTSSDAIRADDPVNAAASDGAGGYYLAGDFSRIGTSRRTRVVHVLAGGTVDKSFAPTIVGDVSAIAVAGSTVFLGGDLGSVNGTAVSHLAALDTTGALLPWWTGSTDGTVEALEVVGDSLYVGGAFGSASGLARGNVARLSTASGQADTAFQPRANATVRTLDVVPGATRDGDVVTLGGDFTSLATGSGATYGRSRLAAVLGTGEVTGWSPAASAGVTSVAVAPDRQSVLVGGSFTSVSGVSRVGVAQVSASGDVLPFDAQLAGCQLPHVTGNTNQFVPCSTGVDSVAWSTSGDTIYVGGLFTTTRGVVRHDAAAFTASTGDVTAWAPLPGARVRTIVPLPGGIVLGGDFTSVGGIVRRGLAKLDLSTGRADPSFQADTDNIVLDIELDATKSRLYAGGSFRTVGGFTRNKVAVVAASTGAVDPVFKVGANKDVNVLAVRGGALFLGGLFTKIGTVTRQHVAKVSATSGLADPAWSADTSGPGGYAKNGAVLAIAVTPDASRVFLGGGFSAVKGKSLSSGGLVALDGASGALLPSQLGGVQRCGATYWINRLYLSDDGQRLYGGDECPDYVYQWDAVNLSTQRANGLTWITKCNGGMQGRLEVNGHFYYGSHGGDRDQGGYCWDSPTAKHPVPQQRNFVFSSSTGALLDWAPEFDTPMGVWAYAAVPQGLLVGGDFTIAGDRTTQQQGLALFRGTP